MQQFLTWLWQGTMLAVGVWGVLRLLRPNAATRFVIWWAALLGVLLLLALPLGRHSVAPAGPAAAPSAEVGVADDGRFAPLTVPAVPATMLAVGIGVWLGLSLLGLVHLGVSVSHLQQLKLACRPFPLGRERRLSRWTRVRDAEPRRRTRLCLSEDVRSASVLGLGVGSAIIAIHPALLADLDDEELDHVILHEYAHVQRRDDWLYVVQLALQALLVVHPAVSSIGRALRLEREAACDDWVVSQSGMATTYARSLTKVAAFELATPNDLVATMGVIGRDSDLTRRVERLLAPSRSSFRTPRFALVPAVSVATLVMAATMGLWRMPPVIVMDGAAGAASEENGANEPVSTGPGASASAIATVLDPLARAAAIIVTPPESRDSRSAGAMTRKVAAAAAIEGVPDRTSLKRADVPARASESAHTSVPVPADSSATFGSRVFAATWWPATAPLTPTPAVVTTPSVSMTPTLATEAAHPTPTTVPADVADAALAAETSGIVPESPATANAHTSGPWQRAAGVGVSVGQGAKRIGTATGGFVSRVAAKVWP
jgi:beta-lactamase regulating signal transducer with metallopeptidase domain